MKKTFNMQFIRYINLFSRITKIRARHCFPYNNMLVFVVPRNVVERAIGRNNENLRRLSDAFGKRIRIVGEPKGYKDVKSFVSIVVSPVQFQSLEIREKELLITAGGRESKALLIGRERAREQELKDILEQYFEIKNIKIL